ncbi:MAG: peptidoglycan DD-metalloendopeptidase family protein [Deltaproteobacteria bacterium]|nr:peptidoglycan DD-metalloendopeptidase family protein [Deltaproteobacteria bacterium]
MAPTVALALAIALLPGVALAAERSEPSEREQLLQRYGQVLEKQLGLLQTLDHIEQHAEELQGQILRLSAERTRATDALHEAERQRAAAQARLEVMRLAVQARLRAVLRIAQLPSLRFALSHGDFADSVRKDRLLRRLIGQDKVRLAEYRAQLTNLETLTRQRDAALQALDQLDLDLHRQKAQAESERRDKTALLAEIDADRHVHQRAVKDIDLAHQALTAHIEALQEWHERKYTFSMVQGKLLPPIGGRVEVGFGEIKHPRFGTTTLHRGLDLRAGSGPGQAVRAVFWGRVAHLGWLTGYGETIILDHGRGWHTIYAHVEEVKVAVGEVVKSRQRIADIGQTGSLKGRYLYFEIRHKGQPVDPGLWLR